jgi:hypothetical protein
VPVTSRRAYIARSAGASPDPAAQITPPTSRSIRFISSFDSDARHPAIDSSLSSVPPVCPRPRPDSCGTATPSDAMSGTSGSVILSPTPPVECLSMAGRPSPEKLRRSPLAIIAAVRSRISSRSIPWITIAMSSALICSGATTPRVNASTSQSISARVRAPAKRLRVIRSTTSKGSGSLSCSMPPAYGGSPIPAPRSPLPDPRSSIPAVGMGSAVRMQESARSGIRTADPIRRGGETLEVLRTRRARASDRDPAAPARRPGRPRSSSR